MAYFHCLIGGGSSGGGYELTVTCDSAFASSTITCTDGVTTLTQTCPSSSPYEVVFEIPNGGDWTISGTTGGHTVSTGVSIPTSASLIATIQQTVTIYSAKEDTISYTDIDGATQTITFASGASSKQVTIEIEANGSSITFVSSVAKDPDDLTSDYSKTVTITRNTTNVYVMPDNALYWWGYESSDLDNPSQWPGQTANVACTKYTNYCDATPGSTSYASIGQKGITSALSKAHAVVDTISGTSAYDVSLFFTTASTPPSFVYVSSLATGLKALSLDYSNTVTTPYCITVGAQKNCSAKIYALWYEE